MTTLERAAREALGPWWKAYGMGDVGVMKRALCAALRALREPDEAIWRRRGCGYPRRQRSTIWTGKIPQVP